MLVYVAEGDVVEGGVGEVALEEDVVVAEHHGLFGAEDGGVEGDVGGEDGGDGLVEGVNLALKERGEAVLELPVDLFERKVPGFFAGEECALRRIQGRETT